MIYYALHGMHGYINYRTTPITCNFDIKTGIVCGEYYVARAIALKWVTQTVSLLN